MKVIKENEQSLFVKPFAARNELFLATTVFIYFDLNNPDSPLTEQELWQTIPDQLGQNGVLDMGMPKPRGEILIAGKCFTPRGTLRQASQISLRVGTLTKSLQVFGNRSWKKRSDNISVISDPEPFSEMEISWNNAFGGENFEKNPLGKGMESIQLADGSREIPLPNIEDPQHLIREVHDKPDPAGFGPLDVMWPQRFQKQGTYDKKWLKDRWPAFPDDMNYEFFNCAPEDQFLPGFYTGDETIEIKNMHPDIQVINSHLPRIRVRCFVTKLKNLKESEPTEELFQEVSLRVDTLWLFPHLMRGVAMFRGTTEIIDDEYADVRYILLATESRQEEPKSIEHYLDHQKKFLKRAVALDPAPFDAAKSQVAKAMKRVKAIPKDIEEAKKGALGKAPKKQHTPHETVAQARQTIAQSHALIDRMEAQTRNLLDQFGHLVSFNMAKFDTIRNKLNSAGKKADETLAKVEKAQQKGDETKDKVSQLMKENPNLEKLKAKGVDPDNLIPVPSVNPWHDHGFPLVVSWCKNLNQATAKKNSLYKLGFNDRTMRRAWMGINPEKVEQDKTAWGLEAEMSDENQSNLIEIPPGLVLPGFFDATLDKIVIRPEPYSSKDQDVVIEGSSETPLFLPSVPAEGAPIICIADELEAWLIEQEIGDACSVLVMEKASAQPDEETTKIIDTAPAFLIVVPLEQADDSSALSSWQKVHPEASFLSIPYGDSVFETREQGTDIRTWIMDALPDDFVSQHQVEPGIADPDKPPKMSPTDGLTIPKMDVMALVTSLTSEIKAVYQPQVDKAMALKNEAEEKVKSAIRKSGKDPEKLLDRAKQGPQLSMSESGKTMSEQLRKSTEKIKNTGKLTPKVEAQLQEIDSKIVQMSSDAEKRYKSALTQVAAAEEQAKKARTGEIPDDVKKQFSDAGIDPDKMKKLTREDVVDRYERGESLAGTNVAGVDLSELELTGIDLSSALCQKTNFKNSILSGANFDRTLALEADFTQAIMKKIQAEMTIFTKAIFQEAALGEANFDKALLTEADLTKADCSQARFYMSVLQKAHLMGSNLSEIDAHMSTFAEADATGASFRKSRLTKSLFQKTVLDQVDFAESTINASMFFNARGDSITFDGADLSNARSGGETVFSNATFRNVTMVGGCFRDTDLAGAIFQGSTLEMALFENCDLRGANFYRVPAKKSRFSKSNLEGANLRGLNLCEGSLRKARLVNTDLTGSNLYAVDFYKAVFGETRLEQALLKKTILDKRTEYLNEP